MRRTDLEKAREVYLRSVRTATVWRDEIVRSTDQACKEMFEGAWQTYSAALLEGERVADLEPGEVWITPDDDDDDDDPDDDE